LEEQVEGLLKNSHEYLTIVSKVLQSVVDSFETITVLRNLIPSWYGAIVLWNNTYSLRLNVDRDVKSIWGCMWGRVVDIFGGPSGGRSSICLAAHVVKGVALNLAWGRLTRQMKIGQITTPRDAKAGI
jgi:hypothetical protein